MYFNSHPLISLTLSPPPPMCPLPFSLPPIDLPSLPPSLPPLSQVGSVEGDFALAMSLFHAFELLQLHGLRSFHQFLITTFSSGTIKSRAKTDIIRSPIFSGIMKELGIKLRESPSGPGAGRTRPQFPISGNNEPDSSVGGSSGFFYSHPKLGKLEEVVLEHFRSHLDPQQQGAAVGGNTRVMIFSQYRESVQEIADMLSQHQPLIKAMSFVGHSAGKSSSKGLTQKEQTEVRNMCVHVHVHVHVCV